MESARAAFYVKEYLHGLQLGAGLPDTELQPADDLAILAGNVLVNLWHLTNDQVYLYNAATVLEFASTKSKHSFRIRLLLVQIYRLLGTCFPYSPNVSDHGYVLAGAPLLALKHYRLMNVKQIQADTLSHFILARASTFSLAATGDLTYTTECLESSHIYLTNSQEVLLFLKSLNVVLIMLCKDF